MRRMSSRYSSLSLRASSNSPASVETSSPVVSNDSSEGGSPAPTSSSASTTSGSTTAAASPMVSSGGTRPGSSDSLTPTGSETSSASRLAVRSSPSESSSNPSRGSPSRRCRSSLLKAPLPPVRRLAGGKPQTRHPRRPLPEMLTPLLFVLVDDLGVLDHVVGVAAVGSGRVRGALLLLGLLVKDLGKLVRGTQEGLLLALDLFDIVPGEGVFGLLYGLFYLASGGAIDLTVDVLQGPLDGVDQVVGVVADVGLLATAMVLVGVRLGVLYHLINLRIRKTARSRDRNPLLLARSEIFGAYVDNAVGVDIERNLDLRYTPRSWRYAHELEVPD